MTVILAAAVPILRIFDPPPWGERAMTVHDPFGNRLHVVEPT